MAVTLLLCGAAATLGCGVEESRSGAISDDACGATHMFDEHAPLRTERECTELCIRMGARYVLVAPDRVYQIENQSHAGLALHAGGPVRVTGRVGNGVVTIGTIDAP